MGIIQDGKDSSPIRSDAYFPEWKPALRNAPRIAFKVTRYSFFKKMEIYDLDPYFWKIIICLKIKSTFVM